MGKFSLLERFRIAVDPDFVFRKAHANLIARYLELAQERADFKAAEQSRLNAHWSASAGDINAFLKAELPRMRNRSRWLFRNTPGAVSAMNALKMFVIGNGIQQQSRARFRTRVDGKRVWQELDEFNEDCDDLFDTWSRNADISGSDSSPLGFIDVQNRVLRRWVEDGEVFIQHVVDRRNPSVPLYCQFVEPTQLDLNKTTGRNNNPVTLGVERNKDTHQPLAYWIGPIGKSKRYPASNLCHLFDPLYPGQARGFPLMHAVTEQFFQLDEYVDAELLACKVAACLCAFIERAPEQSELGDILPDSEGATQATDADGKKLTHMQAAMIANLPHGSKVHITQPQKPSATFQPFTEHIQRKIGAGIEWGLSYEALTRDTSKATFAGGRLAQLMDFQAFTAIQRFFGRRYYSPFRETWLDLAVTGGHLVAPGFNSPNSKIDYRKHEWIPPGYQYGINPVQEVTAKRERMRAGISTLADECAALGRDWRSTLAQIAREEAEAARLGITLTNDGAVSVSNGVQDEEKETPNPTDEKSAEALAAAEMMRTHPEI